MFDARIRSLIDPPLNAAGRHLAGLGVTANALTIAGFAVGIVGAGLIVLGHTAAALIIILVSRLADGLDGAVARATQKTDLGGFLDIVLDFIFYGAIPLAFALLDPASNALAAATLLMSFYANGSAFLAYAIMTEKGVVTSDAQGQKSLYYMAGLAEGAETIGFIVLVCLFPAWFAALAYAYATLCFASTAGRLALACRTLD